MLSHMVASSACGASSKLSQPESHPAKSSARLSRDSYRTEHSNSLPSVVSSGVGSGPYSMNQVTMLSLLLIVLSPANRNDPPPS